MWQKVHCQVANFLEEVWGGYLPDSQGPGKLVPKVPTVQDFFFIDLFYEVLCVFFYNINGNLGATTESLWKKQKCVTETERLLSHGTASALFLNFIHVSIPKANMITAYTTVIANFLANLRHFHGKFCFVNLPYQKVFLFPGPCWQF